MGENIGIALGLVFGLFIAWLVGSIFWYTVAKNDGSDQTILKTILQAAVGIVILLVLASVFRRCGLLPPDGV